LFGTFLFNGETRFTVASDKFSISMPFGYLEGYGTYAQMDDNLYFNGELATNTLDGIMIMASSTKTPSSSSDFLGALEMLKGMIIVKNNETTAKKGITPLKSKLKAFGPTPDYIKRFK
jgi:hypothetical protein